MSVSVEGLSLIENVGGSIWADAVFRQQAIALKMSATLKLGWATEVSDLVVRDLGVALEQRMAHVQYIVGMIGNCLVYLFLENGQVNATVAGRNRAEVDRVMGRLQEIYPVAAIKPDERRVPLWIWTLTQGGPRKIRRMIDVPSWSDIEQNYASAVRGQLSQLMGGMPDEGRLLLWSGVPGTGKTFCLRALAYEWRAFADLHYVADPEVLFGQQSAYLLDVLLDGESDGGPIGEGRDERWRLLVLEDCGEMLALDAKQQVGQALARLLNLTDGLLGQGSRLLVLVTTNEEVRALHPAVARPGRCASKISFEPLSAAEASAWLAWHGRQEHVTHASTLADLYAIAGGYSKDQGRVAGIMGARRSVSV